ncbi:MAG: bifunctional diguanylate cyclase/phosphodiesterase, partial [Ilumatobacteraceae bacterium]
HDVGITVLLIDLDRFKEVNDTLGHHRGDEVLAQIGRRLTGRLRSADTVARRGGDEFAVLLPDVQTADHARTIAAEIAELIAQPIPVDGFELDIRGSIGVAISPFHGTDADQLLQHADVAMYIAKATHSEVEVYDRALDHYSPERLELAAELREAMDDGQLILHYQPKVDAVTRRVTGVEALIRWDHPHRGRLAPGAFIPVIENTELINPLTDFVLATAMAQAAAWRARGWDIPVAVNLSARSVADLSLSTRITRLLAAHGLPATALELELTESAVLHNPDRAVTVLAELRELGVRLSIDDFGTGYASVAYLTQLPIDSVKIDQQFIQPMLTDGKAASIVRFTLDLARTLQLGVVAEGVEDVETAQRLADMGCDLLQGFAICRPAAARDLEAFFAEHAPRPVALVR